LALHKGGSFLHWKEGDEKQRDVVIRSFEPALIEATGMAHPRLLVERNGFGLDARNKEAHDATRDQNPVKGWEQGCFPKGDITKELHPASAERYRYRLEGNGHPGRKAAWFEPKLL
jgi:hypothetical protein